MFSLISDLIKSIYFNFKYLPFRQAIKLPIIVHNAHFVTMEGTVKIESERIYRGMINLGSWGVCTFPNTGFVWQNHGGTVIFRGTCLVGSGSAISVNKRGILIFGDSFKNTAGFKVIVSRKIEFGKSVYVGWNVFIMDTNMHPLKNSITNKKESGGASVEIGDYNWFGTNCVILPGVKTPERIICGLGTIVTRNVDWQPYNLYGGSPIRILRRNVYRDFDDDLDEAVFSK